MILNLILQNLEFYLLIIAMILSIIMMIFVFRLRKKSQLNNVFFIVIFFMFIWNLGLVLQKTFTNIDPIKFDYLTYVGICLLPVALFFLSRIFVNTKLTITKKDLLYLVIPLISLILLWTNDYHHLFYEVYSTAREQTIYGKYFIIHSIYSYALLGISMISMWIYSGKNSGFFSKQSVLITIGVLIPLIVNLAFTLQIVNLSIYVTPISFTIAIFLFALGIIKFKFLNVGAIALQNIVDKISDAFIVITNDYEVIDYNKTFIDYFNAEKESIRNKNIFDLIELYNYKVNYNIFKNAIDKVWNNEDQVSLEYNFIERNKTFSVELTVITNQKNTEKIGILILLKDITQHKEDIELIKRNQETLVERDRLASLGQLIGGVAHNLKTPIMSISGNLQGLQDLITEYDASIGDDEVTNEDHKDIAKDMQELVDKTRIHLSYMSDVITAVKGQAVQLDSSQEQIFSATEVVSRIEILMRHELKNALVEMKSTVSDEAKVAYIKGDINSLVQVLNNFIQNAIYAYKGKSNQTIYLDVTKNENKLCFKIQDYGCGIPDNVKAKLFKEMITTKGKNGTGLGLYMSYSTIKGKFGGGLEFESEVGKGTTFYITIPISE